MEHPSEPHRTVSGYESRPVTKEPDWHGLVAWDLLFNGLTTGLYLVAAIGELTYPELFAAPARWAYLVALAFMSADLVCLILDLGNPYRFHHMLRVFKPSSPMSFGTWCLVVYSLPLTVVAVLSLFPGGNELLEWIRKAILVVGLAPALATAGYKGVLLSTNAQPGWKDARWLGAYLTSSALVLGSAELLGFAILVPEEKAAALLRKALILLIVLNLIPLGLLLANLQPMLLRIFTSAQRWVTGLATLGGGVSVPLILLASFDDVFLTAGAVFLILLGNLIIRMVIIKIPHAYQHAMENNSLDE